MVFGVLLGGLWHFSRIFIIRPWILFKALYASNEIFHIFFLESFLQWIKFIDLHIFNYNCNYEVIPI